MNDNQNHSEEARRRNLKRALTEFDRLSDELDIPRDVRNDATSIYRKIRQEGKLPGRSVEEVVAATLYLMCRDHDIPKTPRDFSSYSEYDRQKILRTASFIEEVTDVSISLTEPHIYVDRIGEDLNLSQKTTKQAKELLDTADDKGVLSGVSPTGGAAGAIYAAGKMTGEKPTQKEISNVIDVSNLTIRNRYQDIIDANPSINTDETK